MDASAEVDFDLLQVYALIAGNLNTASIDLTNAGPDIVLEYHVSFSTAGGVTAFPQTSDDEVIWNDVLKDGVRDDFDVNSTIKAVMQYKALQKQDLLRFIRVRQEHSGGGVSVGMVGMSTVRSEILPFDPVQGEF